MALSTELYGLKSAGVYRFEKDQSVMQNTVEPLENVRLLVGFSKIGPFNTPVYITTTKEFTDTFGNIDRSLEKKGAYFHRSCLAALSAGPIYALNLLSLTESDKVPVIKFTTSSVNGEQTINPDDDETSTYSYQKMYNIDTFYTPSEECFLDNIGRKNSFTKGPETGKGNDTNCIFNFTNIGKTPISVIVTKSSEYNVSAYDITAQEWYGKGNVPGFIKDTSYISDFMVDVYVLSGNWGGDFSNDNPYPYERFASDIKFSKYFDKKYGVKRYATNGDTSDTLFNQFLNESDVNLIGKYTGCLIPGFVDKNGRNLYIEYLINSDINTNGLMCSVNEQIFDDINMLDGDKNGLDLVGHNVWSLIKEQTTTEKNVNLNFISYNGNVKETDFSKQIEIETPSIITVLENEFLIPFDDEDGNYKIIKVGNYVVSSDNRLTRIESITKVEGSATAEYYRKVTCQDKVQKNTNSDKAYVIACEKLTNMFKNYSVFTLNGFKLKETHLPDGTNKRQHEILDLLTPETEKSNLYNALIDRELIQFRYVVDTFGYGIEPMCKSQYTRLCQGRKSAFAIINAPSVTDFKISEDPSFLDSHGAVSAEYIAKGGNPSKNPTKLFSLPDKINGASWGSYYYPYLKVYSNYTTVAVPPAAYVSNNYVAKYGAGSPWTLVAGQNRGVISGNNVVGVEATLIRENRDWLEPFGINSIIYQNNIGCVIYANKTAQQKPQSALSSINCREACIYVQDGIEKILRNYLFEVNTAQTRLEIKTLVDNFLDTVKNNGGVYDYKTVMDKSNNTNEVIDHNMGVIDVFIEPVRGLEILVQKLTILRTGAIESGSFE